MHHKLSDSLRAELGKWAWASQYSAEVLEGANFYRHPQNLKLRNTYVMQAGTPTAKISRYTARYVRRRLPEIGIKDG